MIKFSITQNPGIYPHNLVQLRSNNIKSRPEIRILEIYGENEEDIASNEIAS
jgi:hypothetical protein